MSIYVSRQTLEAPDFDAAKIVADRTREIIFVLTASDVEVAYDDREGEGAWQALTEEQQDLVIGGARKACEYIEGAERIGLGFDLVTEWPKPPEGWHGLGCDGELNCTCGQREE